MTHKKKVVQKAKWYKSGTKGEDASETDRKRSGNSKADTVRIHFHEYSRFLGTRAIIIFQSISFASRPSLPLQSGALNIIILKFKKKKKEEKEVEACVPAEA